MIFTRAGIEDIVAGSRYSYLEVHFSRFQLIGTSLKGEIKRALRMFSLSNSPENQPIRTSIKALIEEMKS